ncbi:MHO_1580 family protein [Metamycoplasma auris]|uniref:Uncharacterized protein n=1 Tax=Metamycoplasma auris TaxID=51363 RepID=A0A2W7GCK2_9BACT|nr:hypothetical protein [Metamycoplasma auris]PZW01418.1 hypothetical protein BCF89_10240 [Metamycoplasma auris]
MLLNTNEIVHIQKKVYEYKEKISARLKKYIQYGRWNSKKEWDFGLKENEKVELNIIRDIKNNSWVIEMTMPSFNFDHPSPLTRTIELNKRKLKIDEIEQLPNKIKKIRLSKYQDDNSLIKLEDLKEFGVHFVKVWSRETHNMLSFQIDFEIEKNKLDFEELNVRENNLKFDFIESINFVITKDTSTEHNPFENNTGFVNNLVYDIDFYDIKQNDFFYKVMQQRVELKSQNQYYSPDREFAFDLFRKIYIDEGNQSLNLNLKKETTSINNFKYKIDYYIDRNNQWDKEKKSFFETKDGEFLGYHLPIRFKGDFKIKYQSLYDVIDSSKTINYIDNFANKIFDEKEGLIKLYTEVIKMSEENLNKDFDNWTTIKL